MNCGTQLLQDRGRDELMRAQIRATMNHPMSDRYRHCLAVLANLCSECHECLDLRLVNASSFYERHSIFVDNAQSSIIPSDSGGTSSKNWHLVGLIRRVETEFQGR